MNADERKVHLLKAQRLLAESQSPKQTLTTLEFCDNPPPDVVFEGRSFCLTGVFEHENGDRVKCEAAIRARGGFCSARPTQTTNYVVLGTYADESWTYTTYGKKILTVVEWKRAGSNCKIISEKHWLSFVQQVPELQKEKQIQYDEQTKSHQILRLKKELQQLQENQKQLFQLLKKQLKPSDYQNFLEKLQNTGFIPNAD